MELIFGLLPWPVAGIALCTVAVSTFAIKLWSKSKLAKDVAGAVQSVVVTRDRIDQTVEAVLAYLKVNPEVADKLGDLVAEIALEVLGIQKRVASRSAQAAVALEKDGTVNIAVASKLAEDQTLTKIITDVGDPVVAGDQSARTLVASRVVKAYSRAEVL